MRLRAFLEGLVSYKGDSASKGDYVESDDMKAHRQSTGSVGDKAQMYADKMSIDQMQDEIKDANDMLDDSETEDQMNRYEEKIKALQAAIKIKKQRE